MIFLEKIRSPVCLSLMMASLFLGCSSSPENVKVQNYSYSVVREYPHDSAAFTQGLAWEDGIVFEATGLLGKSSLRRVDLETGKVEKQINLPVDIFGEGVTVFQDKVFQLTWKKRIIRVYDKEEFRVIGSYFYPRQGWGITHDNRHLITSDGSSQLYFLNPNTLDEERRITVYNGQNKVRYLNELEYIKGKIYANIYQSDKIAIINPDHGMVEGWVDLSNLRTKLKIAHKEAILNGIMHDRFSDRLFVTGKFWPSLYEIRLIPEMN